MFTAYHEYCSDMNYAYFQHTRILHLHEHVNNCRPQWPRGLMHELFSLDRGIVGSNPSQGMDVCVRLFCVYVVLCVGRGLATG
jgi:hypothetical protein